MNFREFGKAVGMISQIGISMVVPILLCVWLGSYLDKTLETKPIFLIIFVILGVLAAFRTLYMLTIYKFKKEDEKKQNEK